ncbi:WD repeat domain-containing protein [Drepanopeziza brunnea f. sp. 'multigermtubi' MB_m1]|uniref:WD repeat domain-containing protein n=1 Tax=Marssonina brunnea f. sp. multigermtubi (strain MB_m1) TaxID=1072389 RepID=K1WPS7_MARBU|nr:WD repeat domain-containing protein [Drepanopeziza brunnea f. sp. 'multigermtubi' MB_m1]EKD19605.1 WD repeat domain-containing protein [Drepanopeziza brunnea f. sp. 'multigermtubi' MB_m1]
MPDPLPKIKVNDVQYPVGTANGAASESLDSPSTITDSGYSARPRSATSSEGNNQSNGKKSPINNSIRNSPSREGSNGASPPPIHPTQQGRPTTAIDPLSHHILKRTNTENTIPQKLRSSGAAGPDSSLPEVGGNPISPDLPPPGKQLTTEINRGDSNSGKDKKKGVSFLSRFSIGGKKKDSEYLEDDESEQGDQRTEGMNAHVFSSSIGANGYIPQHKEPPRYIKVRANNKKDREFDRMFLAQELSGTKQHASSNEKVPGLTTYDIPSTLVHKIPKSAKSSGAVWATEFSICGRYLAAAGKDQVVRVWAVISNSDERQAHEYEEDVSSSTSGAARLSAPVFRSTPIREFEGHTGDILDLSWSKNNFLLSSSMDKTVRLWHISRKECLCTFKHKDFVTSIAFHPRDDRFFLAGSLDSILRLWSIPDKSVSFWKQLPDLITAVAFSPDGKTAIAGVLSGLCLFYETAGLNPQGQIHVRSSRGKNAKGSKITGIRTTTYPANDLDGEVKVLVTSNDSRVRLYNLKDKTLEMKFRGHENTCSQINASFSDDATYVICGSEDRKSYIWNTGPIDLDNNKDKRPLEFFEAHSAMVTATAIAPTTTRQLLSASGDPIYDLCNPPPITLLSREESNASCIPPPGADKRHSDPISEPVKTPAYLARSTHNDGLIIVTADYLGSIKVFRCDCAYQKRRNDSWENGSTFSKRVIRRSGSTMTRTSGGSHRASVSHSSLPGGLHSDQILSWRNEVSDGASTRSRVMTSHSDRSISPGKFTRKAQSQFNLASTARQTPYAPSPIARSSPSISTTSPPQSIYGKEKRTPSTSSASKPPKSPMQPPTPSFVINRQATDDNPSKLNTAQKTSQFWNVASWKPQPQRSSNSGTGKKEDKGLRPALDRGGSVVSKLSSEEEESGEADGDESEGESLSCRECNGRDFRARKVAGKGLVMACTRCGAHVE